MVHEGVMASAGFGLGVERLTAYLVSLPDARTTARKLPYRPPLRTAAHD
jgi:aspartyl/asparaginyl-tRNA synthetase